MLPHNGRRNPRYRELAKMVGVEIARLGKAIDMTRPHPQDAIVLSYESRWPLNAVLGNPAMKAITEAYACHGALMADSFCVDAMDPARIYRLSPRDPTALKSGAPEMT